MSRPTRSGDTLADLIERVLDKGVVIAGDIRVNLLDIELLTIKIRLLVASVDKAKEMGIDWWAHDPLLSSDARKDVHRKDSASIDRKENDFENENKILRQRVRELESRMRALEGGAPPRKKVS
jgi:hypothetical protein